MSVRKSKKQKKQPPQKCSSVAVTRPEDEQDHSELEKKAAAMYGFDIEADRRLDNEHWERRRRLRDRYHGALLGLAAGDALGTTLEFKTPRHVQTFKPLSDMVGGGPFNLQPGQWTDDTSMALCLGESLLQCKGSIPRIKWIGTCAGGERRPPELHRLPVLRHRHHRQRGALEVYENGRPILGLG